MADTYTTASKARLIQDATRTGTWGPVINSDSLELIDDMASGVEPINLGASTTYSLAAFSNGTDSESRASCLKFTGTPASAVTVTVPASVVDKRYRIENSTGQLLTLKYAASTGVVFGNLDKANVWCNGTEVYDQGPGTRITLAEIAALVTPTDYSIPNHLRDDIYNIKRYGALEGADNTVAIQRANAVALAAGTAGIIALTCGGFISTGVVITAPYTTVAGYGNYYQFAPGFVRDSVGPGNWTPYNVMFISNAPGVTFVRIRNKGNLVVSTSNYFHGTFTWFAAGVVGGEAYKCDYENLRYDGVDNSVAVQTSSTSSKIRISKCNFTDCCGAVSLQGVYNKASYCISEKTNASAGTPLTKVAGATDQPFGTDGSTGCEIIHCKVINSSLVPPSGALIGANVGATDFTIAHNKVLGFTGGVALYIRSSSHGIVKNNLIDGLSTTSIGNWCFLRVDADCENVEVDGNKLRRALVAGVGTGTGINIYTGGNTCTNNKVLFGSVSAACLDIGKATTPAETVFDNNYYQSGGIGVVLGLSDNILASTGIEVPIIHRNNTFATPITTPYSCTGASRQVKFYIENDKILSTSYAPTANVLPPRIQQMFRTGLAANFGFSVGKNLLIHGVEVPSGANYYLSTYETGDEIIHSQTVAGGSEGWKCTTGGTLPDGTPYSQAGTSTNTSPIITALANTTLVLVGDYVSPSAGFATTGPYKVIAKTSTTLTLDTNANATASPTVTHFPFVWKAKAAVAA